MAEPAPTLTEKQLRFCREYAVEPNGTQAYRRAFGFGVPYRSARTLAARLLANVDIQEEIGASRREFRRRTGLSAARVLRGLAAVAFADMDDCFDADDKDGGLPRPRPWSDIPAATRRAMQGVKIRRKRLVSKDKGDATDWEMEEVEYKFPDKNSAFDKLCRHLGLTKGDFAEAAEQLLKVIDLTGGDDAPTPPADPPPG